MRDILVLVLSLLVFSPAESAAQNPFAPPPGGQPAAAAPAAEPSAFTVMFRKMIDTQRTMMRDIGRYMRDIKEGTSRSAIWVGIGFAFLYGAVHAVGPGHGKMVVASYFVGHEARIGKGLLMGAQIAVTHVLSAVILVSLVDLTFRQFLGGVPAESKGIRLVSYGLIVVIGLYLLYRAVMNAFFNGAGGLSRRHHHGDGRQQTVLAMIAGLVPCTGAILVMLFALANDILLFGVILVAAISAGMALTMSTIGAVTVLFRRAVVAAADKTSAAGRPVALALEHAGAILILLVGITFFSATLAL